MKRELLYLKIDKNVQVKSQIITVGDIASVVCSEPEKEKQVKALELSLKQIQGPGRYVCSALDVIDAICRKDTEIEIHNLGEADFIITMMKTNASALWLDWAKTVFVCLLAFFGAAFSIMAFNNDISVRILFGELYETFTGTVSSGFTILEISYSFGVGLGILIFFHHFARKKQTSDPTPLEVEMQTYEEEIDDTMIKIRGREEPQI